jgi:capsular polysaccharide biosynthesis protein
MSNKTEREQEFFIDNKHLLMSLLKKSWLILICGVMLGTFAFFYNSFFVTPKYSSSVMLYVNNKSSLSLGGSISGSISAADLSASQSLIDTYMGILMNRTTMEEVAEKAGVDYSHQKLMRMVSANKLEGTELFYVTVTGEDPYEAAHIANCISEVLSDRIEEIIDGSSLRLVDKAVPNLLKVSPNIAGEVFKYFLIGCFLAGIIIAIFVILDDTIRSEDYVSKTYDLPILSIIPMLGEGTSAARGDAVAERRNS